MEERFNSITEHLTYNAKNFPNKIAYIFLEQGEEVRRITNLELYQETLSLASYLQKQGLKGERVLLLYPSSIEFIKAFMSCLYAGCIAVPAYVADDSRATSRISSIIKNCEPKIALTLASYQGKVKDSFQAIGIKIQILATDNLKLTKFSEFQEEKTQNNEIAFLQYTSGSTSDPKGVMVTHNNIIHNLEIISKNDGLNEKTVIVSWLPIYHDMGLISGILLAIKLCCNSVFMSQNDFIRSPLLWIKAISKYRGSFSAAPNFAFELCNIKRIADSLKDSLDLSCWKYISNGAEPIKASVISEFTNKFKKFGLPEDSVKGAYGMAETTLFTSATYHNKKNKILHINKKEYLNHSRIKIDNKSTLVNVSCGSPKFVEKLYIVNPENFSKCEDGNVGEIWVKDPSVAKGYWNNKEKTQEIFHAYEVTTGHGPFLRTGDLGFIYEGELYISGRLKDLIIINGQNIYPQDIELLAEEVSNKIRTNSLACFSIEKHAQEKIILVLEANIKDDESAIFFRQINEKINYNYNFALYDIVLIKKGTSCKTTSGKIQRQLTKKLYLENKLTVINSMRASRSYHAKEYLAPKNKLQQDLAIIWKEVLGMDEQIKIGVNDNFFHLGGNSFTASILISRIYGKYMKKISITDFIKNADIYHLEKLISKQPCCHYQYAKKIKSNKVPLASNQQQLWFFYKALPENTSYNIAYQVIIKGKLSIKTLQKSFELLISKHEALRINILDEADSPMQIIKSNFEFSLEEVTLAKNDILDDLIALEANRIFNLEKDLLIRAKLFSDNDYLNHCLLISIHHIICDSFSVGILTNDLIKIYNNLLEDGEIDIKKTDYAFKDYVCYKNDDSNYKYIKEAESFWQKNQENYQYLKLPNAHNKLNIADYVADNIHFDISKEIADKIIKLCNQNHCTLFDFLISVLAITIFKNSAQNIFNIATPVSNRNMLEFQNVAGYFTDTLLIKEDFTGKNNVNFIELMKLHRELKNEVNEKYNISFAKILSIIEKTADLEGNSPFQLMFTLQNSLPEFSNFKNTKVSMKSCANKHAKTELSLEIYQNDNGSLTARMEYASDILEYNIIEKICNSYQIIINNLVSNPTQKIKDINYLSETDYNHLFAANFKNKIEKLQFIDELISKQASIIADNIAVSCSNVKITYAELEEKTNNLANYLIENGLQTNELVAVIIDNSPELIISLIAILKAGAAYLPIDINYPKKRIEYIIQDSNVKLIVTKHNLKNSLNIAHNAIIYVDYHKNLSTNSNKPEIKHSPDDLVYVIYTSGSTGKPKGVMNYKKGFANLLDWYANSFDENLNILNFNSPAFDLAQKNLFAPLIRGNCLHLCNYDPLQIIDIIAKEKITWLNCAPSLLYPLIELDYQKLSSLKMIFLGGEEINMKKINKLQNIRVFNSYGPTEASDVCSYYEITDPENITIGKAIPNVYLYILDDEQNILPYGVAGEIYIGGIGVGAGYINNNQLTKEKFIDDPYKPGKKLFKTGDLAKWQIDGNIKFITRNDSQIKIRGIRIEPIEIENELLANSVIEEAVIVKKTKNNKEVIAAYLVVNKEISEDDIAFYLHGKIPNYMIPNLYYFLPKLPVNPNGKVDKKLLSELDFELPKTLISPRNNIEQRLLLCWQKTLNLTNININDSFFQLGGNSLLSLNLISEIYQNFHLHINISELYNFPNIEAMARLIQNKTINKSQDNYLVNFSKDNFDHHHNKNSSLFILHGLGGNLNSLYRLASGLNNNLKDCSNIYGLEIPGYNEAEIIFNSANELIDKYVDIIIQQKQKNIILIGWSYGALIAYNIAKKLSILGFKLSHLILIDADSNYEKFTDLYLEGDVNECYNDENLLKLIKKYDSLYQQSDDIKNDFFNILGYSNYISIEQRDNLNKVALNNIKNVKELQINEKIKVDNILVVKAKESNHADKYCGWHNYFEGNISSKTIAGDHWSIVNQPQLTNLILSFITDLGDTDIMNVKTKR